MDQAEELRELVRNSNGVKNPTTRVITVTSGKGGVGKTNTSINLALQLAATGKRVVVLDADFGLANIEVMLGIRPTYNLADLMFKGKELKDIISEGPENIRFISGGSGIQELARMTREQVIYLTGKLAELDSLTDYIIVDTGAGISDNVLEFVIASSEVILVATPEPTSITDAYALLKALNNNADFAKSHPRIRLVSNRVRNEAEGQLVYKKMNTVVEKFLNFSLEYLGSIPEDENVQKSVMHQQPVVLSAPMAPSTKAFYDIAMRLEGAKVEIEEDTKGISRLFSNLIRNKFSKKQG